MCARLALTCELPEVVMDVIVGEADWEPLLSHVRPEGGQIHAVPALTCDHRVAPPSRARRRWKGAPMRRHASLTVT